MAEPGKPVDVVAIADGLGVRLVPAVLSVEVTSLSCHDVCFSVRYLPLLAIPRDGPDTLIDVTVSASDLQGPGNQFLDFCAPVHEVASLVLHLPRGGGTTTACVSWPTPDPRTFVNFSPWSHIEIEVTPHGLSAQQAAEIGWAIDNPTQRTPCTAGFCEGIIQG